MNINESLKKIWINSIQEYYSLGLICSERNLQAEFYHHLRNELKDEAVIWVEPTLSFQTDVDGLTKMKPDLLITKGNKIISMIELKYNPAYEVDYKKDLNKLYNFSQVVDNGLRLKTNVSEGGYLDEFFVVSKDIVTCFAVICKDFGHALKKEKWKGINIHNNFLHLTGIVYGGEKKSEFLCS